MTDKGIPRHNYVIKSRDGQTIGRVTSGTQSPSLGKASGMGYVLIGFSQIDTEIFIQVREKMLAAKVVKIPFA